MRSVILSILLALPSWGAIAKVQNAVDRTGSNTALSLAFVSNNTAGDCLVAMAFIHASGATPTLTIASTESDSWTSPVNLAITTNEHLYIWKAVAVGGANTVTVTASTTGEIALMVSQWSGADASCTVDKTASANAGSGTQTSGSMTPSTNGQVAMGFAIASGSAGAADLTALDFAAGTVFDTRSEYQIQTTATPVAISFTGGSGAWGALGITLKAPGGATNSNTPAHGVIF
jgi:hypothetical protein